MRLFAGADFSDVLSVGFFVLVICVLVLFGLCEISRDDEIRPGLVFKNTIEVLSCETGLVQTHEGLVSLRYLPL